MDSASTQIKINHISIISIPVRDQQVSKSFYVDALGFNVVRDNPFEGETRWIELAPSGAQTNIVLVTWFEAMPPGSVQGLVLDTSDVEAAHRSLQARGISTSEIESAPWARFFTLHDPDGNSLVIQQEPNVNMDAGASGA